MKAMILAAVLFLAGASLAGAEGFAGGLESVGPGGVFAVGMTSQHQAQAVDLFTPHDAHRRDDPETSVEAAERVKEFAGKHHKIILGVLGGRPHGLTSFEITESCELTQMQVLARDPYCQADGCNEWATEVDHIKPTASGGSDRVDNLQALCKSCHRRKTAIEDGGWGN